MKCQLCGKENPDDSIYCEYCGGDIQISLANQPVKSARKKPSKKLIFSTIIMTILLAGAVIWAISLITSPKITMVSDSKYEDYKYYAQHGQEIEYTLINNYGDDFDYADEIEIPLSDIEGNWYVLIRTYKNGNESFASEAEYTAVVKAKDSFDVKFVSTLFNGFHVDGSEFKPEKWTLRTAKGSFYQNILALYVPGKNIELVFKLNRLINGEQGFFIDVAYDEKSFFGQTTLYQVIIVKMQTKY